jgi:hypothetical protein
MRQTEVRQQVLSELEKVASSFATYKAWNIGNKK